jgi:hypothetical protein
VRSLLQISELFVDGFETVHGTIDYKGIADFRSQIADFKLQNAEFVKIVNLPI